jgi:hypothetical protein
VHGIQQPAFSHGNQKPDGQEKEKGNQTAATTISAAASLTNKCIFQLPNKFHVWSDAFSFTFAQGVCVFVGHVEGFHQIKQHHGGGAGHACVTMH